MLFATWAFLLFLAGTLLLVGAVGRSNGLRKTTLVLSSLLFYSFFFPIHLVVLVAHVASNYVALSTLVRVPADWRRVTLVAIVTANLGVLALYKYAGFLHGTLTGETLVNPLAAPLGISFYTLHMISLAVDLRGARRDEVPPPLDYAFYVTFWPQLLAGPITRGHEILPQLRAAPRMTLDGLWQGMLLIVLGLFYKVVLADGLSAPVANAVFGHAGAVSAAEGWAGALAFAVQIYGDFFGYTSCAIGIACCYGYRLPRNFRAPYRAAGFSDFWRRWHITLSRWIRDYVYIPMGGDRRGRVRTVMHLLATMGLAGLWHGAAWTFVTWGVGHGVLLVFERAIAPLRRLRAAGDGPMRATILLWITATFVIVVLLWVPFRATSWDATVGLWTSMMTPGLRNGTRLLSGDLIVASACAIALFAAHLRWRDGEADALLAAPVARQVVVAALLAALTVAMPADPQPFIYFQF